MSYLPKAQTYGCFCWTNQRSRPKHFAASVAFDRRPPDRLGRKQCLINCCPESSLIYMPVLQDSRDVMSRPMRWNSTSQRPVPRCSCGPIGQAEQPGSENAPRLSELINDLARSRHLAIAVRAPYFLLRSPQCHLKKSRPSRQARVVAEPCNGLPHPIFFRPFRGTHFSQTLRSFGTPCQRCCSSIAAPEDASVVSHLQSNPTQSVSPGWEISVWVPPQYHPQSVPTLVTRYMRTAAPLSQQHF